MVSLLKFYIFKVKLAFKIYTTARNHEWAQSEDLAPVKSDDEDLTLITSSI
jgi:hypothetical protein